MTNYIKDRYGRPLTSWHSDFPGHLKQERRNAEEYIEGYQRQLLGKPDFHRLQILKNRLYGGPKPGASWTSEDLAELKKQVDKLMENKLGQQIPAGDGKPKRRRPVRSVSLRGAEVVSKALRGMGRAKHSLIKI